MKSEKEKAIFEVVGETSKSWKIKTGTGYSKYDLFLKSDLSHNLPMRNKSLFTSLYHFVGIAKKEINQ